MCVCVSVCLCVYVFCVRVCACVCACLCVWLKTRRRGGAKHTGKQKILFTHPLIIWMCNQCVETILTVCRQRSDEQGDKCGTCVQARPVQWRCSRRIDNL